MSTRYTNININNISINNINISINNSDSRINNININNIIILILLLYQLLDYWILPLANSWMECCRSLPDMRDRRLKTNLILRGDTQVGIKWD